MVKAAVDLSVEAKEITRKLKASCRQISVLDRKMDILQSRFKRARKNRSNGLFNSVRIQLATLEGVREAFYIYACKKAAEKDFIFDEMRQRSSQAEE